MFEKKIWTYWHDAADIPPIVRHCVASWRIHNPGWKIFLLNEKNWRAHLDVEDLDVEKLKFNESPNRFSDYLRLALLLKHGGVWMDSSIIAFDGIERLMSHEPPYPPWTAPNPAKFVAFARKNISADATYPICDSWFLASERGGDLVRVAKEEMMRMQGFESIAAYIVDIEAKGTIVSNLSSAEYAIVYGWINHALRSGGLPNPFGARLYEGVAPGVGPYWYMNDAWDEAMPLERLCTDASYRTVLVKMGGPQRRHISAHPELSCVLRMQHGAVGMRLEKAERDMQFSADGELQQLF